jgi:hypothetical protein
MRDPDMNTLVERTYALRNRDLASAALHDQLVNLEHAAEIRGWDHPRNLNKLFQIDHCPTTGEVRWSWARGFQAWFELHLRMTGDDADKGLRALAASIAALAPKMRAGTVFAEFPEQLTQLVPSEIRELPARPDGEDLFPANHDGMVVHGFGIIAEYYDTPMHDPSQRAEKRSLAYVGRDGLAWHIERTRGRPRIMVWHEHPTDTEVRWNQWTPGLGAIVREAVLNATPVRIGPESLGPAREGR